MSTPLSKNSGYGSMGTTARMPETTARMPQIQLEEKTVPDQTETSPLISPVEVPSATVPSNTANNTKKSQKSSFPLSFLPGFGKKNPRIRKFF